MSERAPVPIETVVYAWGYGLASLPLFRQYGGVTEAARATARAQGWDPLREGAWAIEMVLPARRDLAQMAVASKASKDPAVAGWARMGISPAGKRLTGEQHGLQAAIRLAEEQAVSGQSAWAADAGNESALAAIIDRRDVAAGIGEREAAAGGHLLPCHR